jgi:cell division protease FtsH
VVFNDISSGAQSDLKHVTDLAEKMVCQWGMSEKIGAMTFHRGEEHPFLGMKLAEEKTFSEEMAWLIDQEIAAFIRGAEGKAFDLVSSNRAKLDALAAALLEEETLDGQRVDEILAAA